jgi:hypothetical protein
MFIINQSGDWAVNTEQVSIIKQTPVGSAGTGIRVSVGNNEFLLASYIDDSKANIVYKGLLHEYMCSDKPTYQMPKDV